MKRRIFLVVLLVSFLNIYKTGSQTVSPEDNLIFKEFSEFAREKNLGSLSISERIPLIGSFFLGTPYLGGTLDETENEELVINLQELDCVTFVEVTLALAFIENYNYDFINDFANNLIKIRYRYGDIDYPSRLHYSTDWLYKMEKKGLLKDITKNIGGQLFTSKVNYMSKNSSKYPQLRDNKSYVEEIKKIEKERNTRTYYFIPEKDIKSNLESIKHGDIILITTTIEGLDTSHLGIAFKKDGKVHLLHASSTQKKVVITEETLDEYISGVKNQNGIIVGRVAREL